jgi:hypothetical protein
MLRAALAPGRSHNAQGFNRMLDTTVALMNARWAASGPNPIHCGEA